jgi:kinesin family protein 2/24
LLSLGSLQRITSQNSANAESSRSHAILQIVLKEGKKVYGKISFIDLAGN